MIRKGFNSCMKTVLTIDLQGHSVDISPLVTHQIRYCVRKDRLFTPSRAGLQCHHCSLRGQVTTPRVPQSHRNP